MHFQQADTKYRHDQPRRYQQRQENSIFFAGTHINTNSTYVKLEQHNSFSALANHTWSSHTRTPPQIPLTPAQTLRLFRIPAQTPCPFIQVPALTPGLSRFWSPPACWLCMLEVRWQVTHTSYQGEPCRCSSPDLRLSCVQLLQTCGIPSNWPLQTSSCSHHLVLPDIC